MHHEPGRRIRRAEHINCRPALRGKRFVFGKHAAYVGLACYRPEALATWLRLPEHRALRPQCLPDDVRVPAGEEIDVGQIDLIEPHPRFCSRGRNYHFSSIISTPAVFEDISLVEQGALPRQGVTRLMGCWRLAALQLRRVCSTATYHQLNRRYSPFPASATTWTNSVSTPPTSRGWRKAMEEPIDPCRGNLSMSWTPVALISLMASAISATA